MIEVKKHCFTTEFNIGDLVAVKEEYNPSSFDRGIFKVDKIIINKDKISYYLRGVNRDATTSYWGEALYLVQ